MIQKEKQYPGNLLSLLTDKKADNNIMKRTELKYTYLAGVIILSIVFMPLTGVYSSDGPGSTAASYLTLPVSPKSAAMGEAGVSLNTQFALFYNPALLDSAKGKDGLGISHSEWIMDTRYDNLSYHRYISERMTVGVGLTYLYRPEIEGYDQSGPTGQTYNCNSYQAIAGLQYSFAKSISVGLNLKYFRENLGDWSSGGIAADIGFLYRNGKYGFSSGVVVQNLGPDIKFDIREEPIPMTIRAGVSQTIDIEKDKLSFTLAADAVKVRYREIYLSAGAEIELSKIFRVRAGYCGEKFRPGDGLSIGAGISIRDNIIFDYSYSPYGELGDFHRVALHFSR